MPVMYLELYLTLFVLVSLDQIGTLKLFGTKLSMIGPSYV